MKIDRLVARVAGRCDIAVEALLLRVSGIRRDGVWLGGHAMWGFGYRYWRCDAQRHPIHVWIERPDGTIVDPTRWVFEGVWPYVYEGPADLYGRSTR